MGGSSSFGHVSWCHVWCASTQSSSGAMILGSGTFGTTVVPGTWGMVTLAAVVVLVPEVQARADLLGTGVCVFSAFCSDSDSGGKVQQQCGPWNDRVQWWLRPVGRVQSSSNVALVKLAKAPTQDSESGAQSSNSTCHGC